MKIFEGFLMDIEDLKQRNRIEEVLKWVNNNYPNLEAKVKWNQPMFTNHGTFIIGFSVAKNHLAVSPELVGINHFSDEIVKSGYEHSKMLIRIPWNTPVDYSLLERIIKFNVLDKADCSTFWRK